MTPGVCPGCGWPLNSHAGCDNNSCINSKANRSKPVPDRIEVAPLTGQVTRSRSNDPRRIVARKKRRAAKASRKRNR